MPTEGPNTATEKPLSAGEILQQERNRRGLSEKEVADKLHITIHYVKALEANKYEKLPGAVFAKGYLKNYAQLLELDSAELIVLYNEKQAQTGAASDSRNRPQLRRRKDRNRPWVIVSVIAFVGGFAALWAYNNFFADEAAGQSDISESDAARSLVTQATSNPEPGSVALSSLDEQTHYEIVEAAEATVGIEAILPHYEIVEAAEAPVDIEPADNVAIIPASSNERLIEIDLSGNDILRISFTGESWVEVDNARANQIYGDLRDAGDVLEIIGDAPFNLLLGDALFTSVSLNGTEIDIAENIRIDNSARLTVGL